MQIQHDPRRKSPNQNTGRVGAKKGSSASAQEVQKKSLFGQVLSATEDTTRENLDVLMKAVDEHASAFLRDPNERNMIQYTDSVRHFVRKAMNNAFSVEKMFDRHNRLYTIVREVDEKMARMTDEIISGQGKAIEMAARIQEIRGVLLDMYI